MAPVLSETYSVFFQVRPPSVVLKTPRSVFRLKRSPYAATQTVFGSVGWMRTAPICPALYRPANVHDWPPSVDLNTPRPVETLLRTPSEAVPIQITSGAASKATTEHMEPTGTLPSVSGTQDSPPSVVRKSPPLA